MQDPTHQTEYDFILVLTEGVGLTRGVEDALFEAGCDDATLSARAGRVYLSFTRRAASLKDAILSAVKDIRRAQIGGDVLRVDFGNLVTQADIARRIGRSRQLIHQYLNGSRGPGGFPSPVCEIGNESPLWSWSEVARWLWKNDMIQEHVLRDAEEVDVINGVLEMQHQRKTKPGLTQEVERVVQSAGQ